MTAHADSTPRPLDAHLDLIASIETLSDDDPAACVAESVAVLETVRAAGDVIAEMHVHGHLGFAHYLLTQDAPALKEAEHSLSLARTWADRAWEAKSLTLLGTVHSGFGDNASAIDLLEQAIEIRREMQDSFGIAVALNNLADTYVEMREFLDRARALLVESYELFTSLDTREAKRGAAISLATLAEAAMAESERVGLDPEASAAAAREALELARASIDAAAKIDDRMRTAALARLVEARALVACGRPEDAETALGKVRDIGGVTSTPYFQIMGGLLTGRIHRLRGDHEAAAREIEAALALTNDTPRMTERVQLLSDLVTVHEERGAYAEALTAHRRLFSATLQQRDEASERRGHVINARLDVERAQLAAEVARLRSAQLESDNRTLTYDALHDALTGLANRRDFDATLAARMSHPDTPVTLLQTDLDHFKAINDGFSHLVGDEVLRRVAQLIGSCVRGTDLVARVGGEEIAVLIGADSDRAFIAEVCERIRHSIESYPWDEVAPGLRVTISVGAASRRPFEEGGQLRARADALLYEAKRRGRNRTVSDA